MEIQVAQKLNVSEIVREYGSRLRDFIRRRVSGIEDAEDILQEVFYRLSEADSLMKPIDRIAAWLFTVARSRITDHYRKMKPELLPEYHTATEEDTAMVEFGELLADNNDSPEIAYLRSLVMDELNTALEELPLEQREAFEMTEFRGLSFGEIAELTGEPVNTLISRKHYAVGYLRERLRDLYDELINM